MIYCTRIGGHFFVYVAHQDREDFFAEVLKLCRLLIQNPNHTQLIQRLATVPSAQRQARVQQAVDLGEARGRGLITQEEVSTILGGNAYPERIWLDAEGHVLPGIDVHAAGRDNKTIQSLHRLIETQGHLGTQTMQEHVAALKAYISDGPFSPEERQRALIALEGARTISGWGSLLSQQPGGGFAGLDGLGLVARFWHFANGYLDPACPGEPENARQALVRALVDSAYTDGFMVCNLGKVQRIVCSLLQGRLKDVAVDDLPVEAARAEAAADAPLEAVDGADVAPRPLSGSQLAALYLQTLQGIQDDSPVLSTQDALCAAAEAWLQDQGRDDIGLVLAEFIQDVKAFFNNKGND